MPDIQEWTEKSRKSLFQKYGRGLDEVVFEMPDGTEKDFLIVRAQKHAAAIVALTSAGEVILTRQYRPGPKRVLWELPGGAIETGMDPRAAAEAELLQETGYRGEVEFVTELVDDAYSTMLRYAFVTRNCERVTEQVLDDEEFIEVGLFSLKEFRDILRTGQMTDVEIGYLGLDYLGKL